MNDSSELIKYKEEVKKKLAEIVSVIQAVSLGDFESRLSIGTEGEDEFTELEVGINLMIEDIEYAYREQSKTIEQRTQQINLEKERFLQLAENSQDLITITDNNANPNWANDAWKKVFGELPYQGSPFEEIHPDDQRKVIEAWKKLIKLKSGRINIDYRYKVGEGYIFLESVVFKTSGLKEPAYFIIAHDVTEIKRAQNILTAKIEELEKLNKFMVGRELKMMELKKKLRSKKKIN